MQPWALVSPASRGIGLALARRILQTTTVPVLATARTDIEQTKQTILSGLSGVEEDRLHVQPLDFLGSSKHRKMKFPPINVSQLTDESTDEPSISAAATKARDCFPQETHYLHLAFSVPGILAAEKSPSQIDHDHALLTFRTNTLGPLLLIKHFSPFLPRKTSAIATSSPGLPARAVWANMSARVGSIADNGLGGWYSYRASKAGVNQVTRTFDHHVRMTAGDKAMCVALHPGTVKTGLSREFWGNVREGKLFGTEFVAERLMEVVCSRGEG